MPVQQEVRKNYIGIVNDTTDDERVADAAARTRPRMMGYLFGRLADVLKLQRKGAPGRSIAP